MQAKQNSSLPDIFLVGAMKSGTTSLSGMLGSHPDVHVPNIKEPNFFSIDINETPHPKGSRDSFSGVKLSGRQARSPDLQRQMAIISDLEDYQSLYETDRPHDRSADCSTSYLMSGVAADEIAHASPNAQIIITLRDPVHRAFSEYQMRHANGSEPGSFRDALARERGEIDAGMRLYHGAPTYVRAGLYHDQVKRYLDRFGRDRVHILIFERFISEPEAESRRLFDFLGLPPSDDYSTGAQANGAIKPRLPIMNALLYKLRGRYFLAMLRPYLPQAVAQRLKALWFDRSVATIDPVIAAELRMRFETDTARLRRLLDDPIGEWGEPAPVPRPQTRVLEDA